MIHFFGDSFTYCQGCTQDHEYYKRTYDGTQKTWVELMSEFLNDEHTNYGRPGISNQTVIDILIQNLKNISAQDTVILCRGTDSRFKVPYSYPTGKPRFYEILIHMFFEKLYPKGDFSNEYYETLANYIKNIWIPNLQSVTDRYDILYNSFKEYFEVNNIKIIIWNLDENLLNKNGSVVYPIIAQEYDDIDDSHWSWSGHAEFFNKIKNNI